MVFINLQYWLIHHLFNYTSFFIYISYIINLSRFLSYFDFDHDHKYPNSRIVVDAAGATQRPTAMSANYGQHYTRKLSNFG